MDDLSQQLQSILSDPQTMGRLQGLFSSLGKDQGEAPAEPAAPAGPDLSALLGALGVGQAPKPQESAGGTGLMGLNPQALSLMTRLAPLLNRANREDDATRLLRALRPLLSEGRQKKVDEAIQILQMLRPAASFEGERGLFRAAVRAVVERGRRCA